MTRFLNSYVSNIMRPEPYEITCGEEDDDFDEEFDDDDAYYGLSDYEDDDGLGHSRSSGRHANAGDSEDGGGGTSGEFRRQRSMSEGSASNLEPADDNRRDHHNQLERKRRASIKTSYNDLREVIPSLRGSKASRVVILQRAVEYIDDLTGRNHDHTRCVETLRRQNDTLDLRVQELQRYMERVDGDEDMGSPYVTSSSSSAANSVLRLYSGPMNAASSTNSRSSSVPVYRLVQQDVADRAHNNHTGNLAGGGYISQSAPTNQTALHANSTLISGSPVASSTMPARTRSNSAMHVITNSNTASTYAFNGMNALSAAVSLVASTNSAFSCTSSSSSSSTSSNPEPPQSSSQRSSPGCLSSASSNSSSSYLSNNNNTNVPSFTTTTSASSYAKRETTITTTAGVGGVEERSLIIDVASALDNEPVANAIGSAAYSASAKLPTSHGTRVITTSTSPVLMRPSSPPSIILTVPIRSSATASANTALCNRIRQRQSSMGNRAIVELDLDASEALKRRRLT